MATERGELYRRPRLDLPIRRCAPPSPASGEVTCLTRAAAPGAEALDLASFRRRDVVRTAPHLAHEPLLLHLAAELPKGLFELLGVFDDYSHNPARIPIDRRRCC